MGYAKTAKEKMIQISSGQAEQEAVEYSCGNNAGIRAFEKNNTDLYKKSKGVNSPWARGFKRGWDDSKRDSVN
jgi:hypothetical protein